MRVDEYDTPVSVICSDQSEKYPEQKRLKMVDSAKKLSLAESSRTLEHAMGPYAGTPRYRTENQPQIYTLTGKNVKYNAMSSL